MHRKKTILTAFFLHRCDSIKDIYVYMAPTLCLNFASNVDQICQTVCKMYTNDAFMHSFAMTPIESECQFRIENLQNHSSNDMVYDIYSNIHFEFLTWITNKKKPANSMFKIYCITFIVGVLSIHPSHFYMISNPISIRCAIMTGLEKSKFISAKCFIVFLCRHFADFKRESTKVRNEFMTISDKICEQWV